MIDGQHSPAAERYGKDQILKHEINLALGRVGIKTSTLEQVLEVLQAAERSEEQDA